MAEERPTILVTAPFRGRGRELLEDLGRVVYDPWIDQRPMRVYDPAGLAERIAAEGADVVVCEADFVMGEALDLPLRAVAAARGEPSNVDLAVATERGIPVLHAPARNADAVAEMTVAMLLGCTRWLVPADRDVRDQDVFKDGTVPYQRYRAWQIAGRTAGLVGLGAVGRATKWRLEGLGMTVIAYDPYNDDAHATLDEVLENADVVSMHAAVTPDTLGMIGAGQIGRMKEGAVYLNSARAGLHDLDALTAALVSGKLAAAGLDHFEGEQVPEGHPILDLENVLLTPHIGGATYDTEENHSLMIATDLQRLFNGERPVHLANPEVFDR